VPRQNANAELIRTLRLRDLLLLFIGSVIGSGIFRTPGPILRQVDGSVGLSLLVWIVGGVLSLLGALTYAELAAANPEAGGCIATFVTASAVFQPSLWLVPLPGDCSGSVAALARAFSEYLGRVLPISPAEQTVAAVVMIGIVTVINVWGTARVQTFRTGPPSSRWASLLSSWLAAGLWSSWPRHSRRLGRCSAWTQPLVNFGLAMISVLWAYEGWQFGTYSAGEVVGPQKAFPALF